MFVPLKPRGHSLPSLNAPRSPRQLKHPVSSSSLLSAPKHTQLFSPSSPRTLLFSFTRLHLQVGVSLLCCWCRDPPQSRRKAPLLGKDTQPEGSESRADTGSTEKLLGESWILGKQQVLNIINKILMRLFNYVYISLYTWPTNMFSLRKHLMRLMMNHFKQQHTVVYVVNCFVTQPARG